MLGFFSIVSRRRVALDVDADVGEGVAREELLQAQRAGRMARAEQDDIAALGSDQPHAAQDERAHEDFAQLDIALDEMAQVFAVDGEHLAFFAHARAHHARRTAQGAHLPGKLARRVHHDQLLPGKAGAHDLDAARENDEHRGVALAGLGEDLAFARAYPLPVRFEARDLRGGQPGKGLVPPGFDGIARQDFAALGLHAHPSSMASSST